MTSVLESNTGRRRLLLLLSTSSINLPEKIFAIERCPHFDSHRETGTAYTRSQRFYKSRALRVWLLPSDSSPLRAKQLSFLGRVDGIG
jgi:hypothetical protein